MNHFCGEETYPAMLAKLDFQVSYVWRGLELRVWGFNDKLKVLLEAMLVYLLGLEERLIQTEFDAIKESVRRN